MLPSQPLPHFDLTTPEGLHASFQFTFNRLVDGEIDAKTAHALAYLCECSRKLYETTARNIERRSAAGRDVILVMKDGSTRTLPLGPSDDLFKRLVANPNSEEADLVRNSIAIIEPDGARTIELCRSAFLQIQA